MNKNNLRIITINGVRGAVIAIFIVLGLIAGFIISPSWACMKLWNYFISGNTSLATINIYQGLLMWLVIALSFYALNGRKSLIGFGSYKKLSNEEIRNILKRAREVDASFLENISKDQVQKAKSGNVCDKSQEVIFDQNQVSAECKEESLQQRQEAGQK